VRRNAANRRPEFVDGDQEVVPLEDMLHITELRMPGEMRGKSRIDLVSETLGMEKALTAFAARFFGSGSVTSGIIEYPGPLTREQASDLASAFDTAHRNRASSTAHKTGVLSGGAKYAKTSVEPNEAQMLESRQFAVEEIARIFRCPPQMLGVTTPGAQSYASVEMNMISFVQNTLRTYIVKLEDAYSRLLPDDVYIRWNVNGILRGDSQSRMSAYSVGLNSGIYSVNDVRAFEDLEPVDGADVHRVPLANVDLDAANLAELDRKTMMAQRLVSTGFEPASVLEALGLPAITHSGVPSVMLQGVAQINPDDPESVYSTGDGAA
jgi:HK97 family phage portal protein